LTTPLNSFVTEHNVDIYLSKLRATFNATERDSLLRLLIAEEDRMARTSEHLENGERRISEGRDRIRRHREMIAGLEQAMLSTDTALFVLETMERTQALLEAHCRHLRRVVDRRAL
jgi:hypothetical protein